MMFSISDINRAAALSLANAGFRVFPARAIYNPVTRRWNKPPCVRDWQTVATADPVQIFRWWQQFPDGIPAFSCTEIIVIDADRHAGGSDGVAALTCLFEEHGDWPCPPVVFTPSDGLHFYFRQTQPPLGNRTGMLPHGLDVRGIGGFIIGPGARLPDGTGWRIDDSQPDIIPRLPTWLDNSFAPTSHVAAVTS
jgi:Bifunctional DNA primase/polymerase, N-terminal